VIVDLEKNTASGLILPGKGNLEIASLPVDLDYPSESIFNSESKLHLCENSECEIRYLDIIFDARGGGYDPRDLIYGIHRSFILPSFYKNN